MNASTVWEDWSCRVRVTVTRPAALPAARQRVVALMADVALAADRFSASSDVSRVNARAGQLVPVSRRALALVDVALGAAERTDGAVDPTVGAHLLRAGYDRDIADVRRRGSAGEPAELPRADWTAVRLDRMLCRVGLPDGMRLDLGATAKAWTTDAAAQGIARHLGTAVLVEIGGDVAVAGPTPRPWQVTVSERGDDPGDRIGLVRGGLATSSTTARRWDTPDGGAHHVIDPRTGRPAEGPWRTVTVWAPSAVAANTASTAALVLGDDAVAFLAAGDVTARLVDHDGRVTTVGAWPSTAEAA